MASAPRGAPSFVYTEPVAPEPSRSIPLQLRRRGIKDSVEGILIKILTSKGLSLDRLSNIGRWKKNFDTETDPEKILKMLAYLLDRLLSFEGACLKEQIVLETLAEDLRGVMSFYLDVSVEEFLEKAVRVPLLKREEMKANIAAILSSFKEERASLLTAAKAEVASIKSLYERAKLRILEVAGLIEEMDVEMGETLKSTLASLESSLKNIERVAEKEAALSDRADEVIAATDSIASRGFDLLNAARKG